MNIPTLLDYLSAEYLAQTPPYQANDLGAFLKFAADHLVKNPPITVDETITPGLGLVMANGLRLSMLSVSFESDMQEDIMNPITFQNLQRGGGSIVPSVSVAITNRNR